MAVRQCRAEAAIVSSICAQRTFTSCIQCQGSWCELRLLCSQADKIQLVAVVLITLWLVVPHNVHDKVLITYVFVSGSMCCVGREWSGRSYLMQTVNRQFVFSHLILFAYAWSHMNSCEYLCLLRASQQIHSNEWFIVAMSRNVCRAHLGKSEMRRKTNTLIWYNRPFNPAGNSDEKTSKNATWKNAINS